MSNQMLTSQTNKPLQFRNEHFWNGLDRCWRIGSEQHQSIAYYFLTAKDTCEDAMWTGLQEDKNMLEILLKQLEKI